MVDSYVGPYKIIREIAEDSIGQVFEAVDQTRNKKGGYQVSATRRRKAARN
jgi:hypothetical protein